MIKYSIFSAIIAVVLTFLYMIFFNSMDATAAIATSSITALIITFWFGKSEKRLPTRSEKNKIIIIYWMLMLLIYLTPVYLSEKSTTAGMFHMVILATAYPMFMLILFKDKFIQNYIKN